MTIKLDNFKPNLAASPPEGYDWVNFPWESGMYLMSPKIDGIRVFCHPTLGPVSRTLKPIPNDYIRTYLSHPYLKWLDGEIVLNWEDPDAFNKTQSAVMSRDGQPTFEYRVFDHVETGDHCAFGLRLGDAGQAVIRANDAGLTKVHFVNHFPILNYEQFDAQEKVYVERGFEGAMIRHKGGKYKMGRSTWKEQGLIKVKRFQDAEGEIIGWEPLERNENEATKDNLGHQVRSSHNAGMVIDDSLLGRFLLHVVTGRFAGVTVSCGSGLSVTQRHEYRLQIDSLIANHQLVTFKYQDHGSKDAPRMPIFKGFRAKE